MSLLSVSRGDSSLDSHTISNSLIRVDALVGFLAVEEVRNKFDDKGNMSGTTDQDDFMDVDLVILELWSSVLTGSRVLRKKSWERSSKCA